MNSDRLSGARVQVDDSGSDAGEKTIPRSAQLPARSVVSTHDKALRINLDAAKYGTFAEIGAGQEVARWFFRVGGAAGTIAKTISAYDMAVSTATYGPADQYVSRRRLLAMLDREHELLRQQLAAQRGESTTLFVFADTVAALSHTRHERGHGWLGVRFQTGSSEPPSEVLLHVHLADKTPAREQEALGILGVNLLYGAFYSYQEPAALIGSLMDGLGRDRVEIDLIKFSGPASATADNRLMSLQLVAQGLSDAAIFTADNEVVQASEVLYKRPILVERGSFRPITKLTLDMLESARAQFLEEPDLAGETPLVLMEMTLNNLNSAADTDHTDFLHRAEILHALGNHVLISNCDRYFSLVEILSRYTRKKIALALGVPVLLALGDEGHYEDLPGGHLEAIGRLYKESVKLYVYPTRDAASGEIVTLDNVSFPGPYRHLHQFLRETGRVESLRRYNQAYLGIHTPDVLAMIQAGDSSWEDLVPPTIVETIRGHELFGYRSRNFQ